MTSLNQQLESIAKRFVDATLQAILRGNLTDLVDQATREHKTIGVTARPTKRQRRAPGIVSQAMHKLGRPASAKDIVRVATKLGGKESSVRAMLSLGVKRGNLVKAGNGKGATYALAG